MEYMRRPTEVTAYYASRRRDLTPEERYGDIQGVSDYLRDNADWAGKSTGGAMEFARHVEAVNRAGGQIAPSKYLPNVPRAVHAGGGKVAFQEGNHPLVPDVLYHGTARDIQSFNPDAKRSYDVDPSNPEETDTGWFGKGHYFTPSPKLAAHYADAGAKRQGGQGANIIPAHVAMKNPLVVDMKAYDSGAKTLDNALSRAGVPMHPRGWRKPSEQTAALVGMGYDGVIATREGKPEEYVAFHPTQIKSAIGNNGNFDPNDPDITKAGGGKVDFTRDNPGGEWLEGKQARAAQHPDMKFMTGSVTGVIGGRSNVFLPTHILKGIAGLNDEVRTAGVHKYDSLLAGAQKGGFDPDQEGNKVVVAVNHYGQPYLLEGNTRVAVAHAMGVPKVKAEVRYWNGAEDVDGPMHPEKVFGMASDSPDITKAGGGRIGYDNGGVTPDDQGSRTGFPELDRIITGVGNLNKMFNPVEAAGQSMEASKRMFAPDTSGWGRVAAAGDMLTGMAGAAIPFASAARPAVATAREVKPLVEGFDAYQGSPHNFPAERLVRMPDGSTQHIVGAPDALPDVPAGAQVLQDYPLGRMRMDKIGTGEGNQSFGYGLYGAENENVARIYRDTLSQNNKFTPYVTYKAEEFLKNAGGDYQKAADAAKRMLTGNLDRQEAYEIGEVARLLDSNSVSNGRMYHIHVKADPNEFINHDAPFHEQPQNVQAYFSHMASEQPHGSVLAKGIKTLGHATNAAKAGIPGVKFLDKGSRMEGAGTRNYVLFDDKPISILRKYEYGGRIHANGGGKMDLRSKAAQVIRNQPQAKGNVDQMLAMMAAKGVKPSELTNAGRPLGDSVSKEELAQHFENAVPQVQVHEMAFPQYEDFTLPSGNNGGNYREHLLHLPARKSLKQLRREALTEKLRIAKETGDEKAAKEASTRLNWMGKPSNDNDVNENYYSSHWGKGVPNVLAHVRMNDLYDDSGKALHVQEVQSDWGQDGREKGFYDPQKPIEVFNSKTGETVHATDNSNEAEKFATNLGSEYDWIHQGDEKPPTGPYVGNTQHWTDLALKHILTEAAYGGHNRVVFSPGEANADLYGQRRPVSRVDLHTTPGSAGYGFGVLAAYDGEGDIVKKTKVKDEKHLRQMLGKQHADKLLAAPSTLASVGKIDDVPTRSISEPNMVLGGHGMVDYYKNYVHAGALKLLQQHDPSIKPESYDLPGAKADSEGYKGYSLPMTETARQSILKNGFQAFKRGGMVDDEDGITAYHGSAYDFPQFDIGKLGTGTGHQAKGHGLYFAGDENDAKNYREMLKDNGSIDIEHESHKLGIPLDRDAQADLRSVSRNVNGDPTLAAKALQARNLAARAMPQEKLADLIDRHRKSTTGHMYKVKLNVKPEELLDWDKPLSEQHPNVQAALSRTMPDYTIKNMAGIPHAFANDKMIEINPNGLTGRDAYVLSRMGKSTEGSSTHQDAKAASEHLLSEGIKGIRYKEGGTHNYVMFHHDPVQVVDKYEYGGTVGKADGGAMGSGNDLQRARVQELIDKHGGDDQAAKEYLRTSLPSIPASSQDFWQKTLDNFDYLKTPKPVQQVATPVAQENAQLGNPEYSTGHTAPHPEKGAMMHDLDAVFPDIATHGRQYYGTGADYDHESFGPISRVNGRPSASVQIYRSVPKDIDKPKINAGDWVTTSPSYAKEHGEANLGNKYKILKKTVRADELATNGDSIHEWGYWPKTAKASGGTVSAALALTRRFTKDGKGATMALKPKGK
jgi:hypothetical protein